MSEYQDWTPTLEHLPEDVIDVPEIKICRLGGVIRHTGIGSSHDIDKLIILDEFPRRRRFSRGRSGWLSVEVRGWMHNKLKMVASEILSSETNKKKIAEYFME